MDPRDKRVVRGDATLQITWRRSEDEEGNHSSSRR
jgi:hypothetical protein